MYKLIEMGSNDTDYQKVLIEEEFEVVIKSKRGIVMIPLLTEECQRIIYNMK